MIPSTNSRLTYSQSGKIMFMDKHMAEETLTSEKWIDYPIVGREVYLTDLIETNPRNSRMESTIRAKDGQELSITLDIQRYYHGSAVRRYVIRRKDQMIVLHSNPPPNAHYYNMTGYLNHTDIFTTVDGNPILQRSIPIMQSRRTNPSYSLDGEEGEISLGYGEFFPELLISELFQIDIDEIPSFASNGIDLSTTRLGIRAEDYKEVKEIFTL